MDRAGERFAAIREALANRKNILTVKEMCELAGVSRSYIIPPKRTQSIFPWISPAPGRPRDAASCS